VWKLTKGDATLKADYGNPLVDDGYALCIYEDEVLRRTLSIPASAMRWKESPTGFSYLDKGGSPDGVTSVKLKEGLTPGTTKIKAKAKGGNLGLPDLATLTGVLDVQLQRTDGSACWGARYTPPFKKVAPGMLKAASDAPPTSMPLPPLWSAIHTEVVGPTCGGCHGGSGGLSGLDDCNAGHAALVGAASTELPAMDRVTPGDPTTSWIMHKLDGTQGGFTAQCAMMFCGQSMPLGSPLLALDVRNAVRTWISDGAPNDCP
jgi:hypothetical protein